MTFIYENIVQRISFLQKCVFVHFSEDGSINDGRIFVYSGIG